MRCAHTVDQIRAAEEALAATLPHGALMQRAATGLAVACADYLGKVYGARVVVLAGSGDNGGDALFAGARLARRGARVDAVLTRPGKGHELGLAALRAAGGRVVDDARAAVARADVVLDGIVGIGGKPGLRPAAEEVLDRVEAAGVPAIAVDVPSGTDVDTGEVPARAVRTELTVTFGTHKVGLLVDPAAALAGSVHLVDIGLGPHLPRPPVEALQAGDVRRLLPTPGRVSHKYSRGVVGVLAGSDRYPGAAVLAVAGAVAGPAGMVRYVGPPGAANLVLGAHPEAVVGAGRTQAWVVGSGLGAGEPRADEVDRALAGGVPVLVDADGLRYLPPRFTGPALLTPHAGELARLLDVDRADVESRPLHHARSAARRWRATVLLKGEVTLVVPPDGPVRANHVGTSWLATAGAGDVLSGICGSLLAAGLDPLDAGSVGAFLHGSAGVLAARGGPVTAAAVAAALPAAARAVMA